jgi:hypothetical protein
MIGYTRESTGLDRDTHVKVITVCQDIANSLDEKGSIDAIITVLSKAFDLVSHDRLLTKLASRAWIRGQSFG